LTSNRNDVPLQDSKFTLVDIAWQVVSQIHSSKMEQLFTGAFMATDAQIQEKI